MIAPSPVLRSSAMNATPAVQTAPKATPNAARLASRNQKSRATPWPRADAATSTADATVSRLAPILSVTRPIGSAVISIAALEAAKSEPTCTRVRCRSCA